MGKDSIVALRHKVVQAINPFFDEFGIDPDTGILQKTRKAGKWRYAGYPHIGDKYAEMDVRVVIVGADLGEDALRSSNTYLRFDGIDDIPNACKSDHLPAFSKCYAHMAGTYATVITVLKEGLTKELYNRIKGSRTARKAMRRLTDKVAKTELIPFFSMTNAHKFVTIGRNGKAGPENRVWIDKDKEYAFLKAELIALNPTVVCFQEPLSGDSLDSAQIEDLKASLCDCVIIRLLHPSTRKKGGYLLKEDIEDKINEVII